MQYVGLLLLGIFVGTIIAIGVQNIKYGGANLSKFLASVFGAAFSGVVFGFIEKLMNTHLGDALFMYPIGLAYSLLFAFAGTAMKNISETKLDLKILGWLHVGAMALGTLLVLLFLFSSGFRSLLPNACSC